MSRPFEHSELVPDYCSDFEFGARCESASLLARLKVSKRNKGADPASQAFSWGNNSKIRCLSSETNSKHEIKNSEPTLFLTLEFEFVSGFVLRIGSLALRKTKERVRQNSEGYLADSLVALSPLFDGDWDEKTRESAKCLGAQTGIPELATNSEALSLNPHLRRPRLGRRCV